MINLRKKTAVERINTEHSHMVEFPTPMVTSALPPKEYNSSFGADFNLILMVKEEGPKRIDGIDKELHILTERMTNLQRERDQLISLVNAIM